MSDNFKFTPECQKAYLAAIRKGVGKVQAAQSVGMTHEGVRLVYKRDPAFKAARDAAEQSTIEAVESALFNAAISGNVTAQIFFLCNRAPERWQYRVHAHVLARNMTDEDLLALARQMFADEGNDGDELDLDLLPSNKGLLPLE